MKWASRDSALGRARITEDTPWPRAEQLTASLIDEIELLRWELRLRRWTDADKATRGMKPQMPKPFPRPGVKALEPEAGVQHMGADPIPMADFAAFWADPLGYDGEEAAA